MNLSTGVASDEEDITQEDGDVEVERGTRSHKARKPRRRADIQDGTVADADEGDDVNADDVGMDQAQDEDAKVDDADDVAEPDGELGEAEAAARNEEERTYPATSLYCGPRLALGTY